MPKAKKENKSNNVAFVAAIVVALVVGWLAGSAIFNKDAVTEIASVKVAQKQPERTCEAIERHMLNRVVPEDEINSNNWNAPETFMNNARIYSDLVRQGCPENSEKFRDLAVRQIEIATALHGEISEEEIEHSGGNFHIRRIEISKEVKEETEVVREARRIMERASRLGEPALRFIAEIEKAFKE